MNPGQDKVEENNYNVRVGNLCDKAQKDADTRGTFGAAGKNRR